MGKGDGSVKEQLNIRASRITRQQLGWLTARWGVNQSEALTVIIDRVYQQERKMQIVQLIEDNAGGLFVGLESGPWYRAIGDPGTFDDDAVAIVNGDTDAWTVEQFDKQPQGELVGEWSEGALRVIINYYSRQRKAGTAASIYMGLQSE